MINDYTFRRLSLIWVFIAAGCCAVHLSRGEAKSTSDARQTSTWYETSYALVIGVNEYTHGWTKLESARQDAELMERELKRRGFNVTSLYDEEATKRNILKVLQTKLPSLLQKNDRLIIYFAGHGQTQTTAKKSKVGYIVPSDGEISESQDQWHSYLSISELKGVLQKHIQSKHALMIFDSCFSGLMFTRGVIRRPQFKARDYLNLNGVMGITSGSENQLAQDGLFTRLFLEGLQGNADQNQDGIINFQELSFFVRQEVKSQNHQQEPQFGILSGLGQMIFKTNPSDASQSSNSLSAQSSLRQTSSVPQASSNTKMIYGAASLALGGGLLAFTLNEAQEIQELQDISQYNARIEGDKKRLQAQYALGWAGVGLGATLLTLWMLDPSPLKSVGRSAVSSAVSIPLISPLVHEEHRGVVAWWSF